MKLVTFEVKTDIGSFRRTGAFLGNKVIDLNLAYALYLFAEEQDASAYNIATARIPVDMIELLKGGKHPWKQLRQL
jgi:hypothetical protein